MNYFKQLTAEIFAYYRRLSSTNTSRTQFNRAAFLDDVSNDKLSNEQVVEVLNQLDYSSKKDLYDYVMTYIDVFDPDEKMVELLDLLDPENMYFSEGSQST